MLGFASALIGEVLTGKGAIAQFGVETGLPINEVPILVVGLAAFNLVAAFLPNSATFKPEE
jgi:photosystem II protein